MNWEIFWAFNAVGFVMSIPYLIWVKHSDAKVKLLYAKIKAEGGIPDGEADESEVVSVCNKVKKCG